MTPKKPPTPVPSGSTAGRALSAEEVTRLQKLREYGDAPAEMQRLTEAAKYFFAVVSTVGALAAGLSFAGGVTINAYGKAVFGVALVLVGAALAAAVFSLAPRVATVNPYAPAEQQNSAFDKIAHARATWLRAASLLFGCALASAGLVQCASLVPERRVEHPRREVATYEVTDRGAIAAHYAATGLPPHTSVEVALRLDSLPGDTIITLPRVRAASQPVAGAARDDSLADSVHVDIGLRSVNTLRGRLLMTRRWLAARDTTARDSVLLAIPLRAPQPAERRRPRS